MNLRIHLSSPRGGRHRTAEAPSHCRYRVVKPKAPPHLSVDTSDATVFSVEDSQHRRNHRAYSRTYKQESENDQGLCYSFVFQEMVDSSAVALPDHNIRGVRRTSSAEMDYLGVG